MSFDLELTGCRTEPLGAYLKALAVLRLVSEQKDPAARAYWKDGAFHLISDLDLDSLVGFFADEYAPTPIVGPWGARSGFFKGSPEKAARDALHTIETSADARLSAFRGAIHATRVCLDARGLSDKASGDEQKSELLVALRNSLPDGALGWLDAAYVLGSTIGDRGFPIVLGTGGNEGSQGFASTFMNALIDTGLVGGSIDREGLRSALLGTSTRNAPAAASGQFTPGTTPGLNQGPGFSGGPSPGAWEMALVFEGAATWVSGASKRHGSGTPSRLSSPFTVRTRAVGFNSAETDEARARGELWLPIWSRPALATEVGSLIAEGRAQYQGRPAATALDMAKAVGALGVSRGIDAFERYAILERNGKSYFAVSVGRFEAFERSNVDLIRQLDAPLDRLDQRIRKLKDRAPARLVAIRRTVDEAIFRALRTPARENLLALVRAIGRLERVLASMDGGRTVLAKPLGGFLISWLDALPDTLELRVAAAIASIKGEGEVGPFRANLIPVQPTRPALFANGSGQTAWEGNSFARRLAAVLERRLIDFGRLECRTTPLAGWIGLSLDDIGAFIEGPCDDALLEDLLFALTWIDWRGKMERRWQRPLESSVVPFSYALLRSVLNPELPPQVAVDSNRHEPGVVALLVAGHLERATRRSMTRLRVAGLDPLQDRSTRSPVKPLTNPSIDPIRLAASLLIPVSNPSDLFRHSLRRLPLPTSATAES